ncbi:lysoplasmalogenase family protein [Arthrobacter glacialis]|uniref:lysoplasmalogenase family protein n=1 Tax=Arthrobacter glacialis TaxID=1664 RepID=UPI000CD44394|nr:lysoplasmalogenase family protein [Arthrobacter glacialis]POH58184.1 hypothetical protein CVS28_12075 [Arthrobacter glacialis]
MPTTSTSVVRPLWWGFVPYIVVSIVHVAARFAAHDALADPTKLLLMPALMLAVFWGWHRLGAPHARGLLLAGLLFSWLGDGAGTFFPLAPTLPLMLLFFGVAHLCYMRAFWQHLAVKKLSCWAFSFAAWWLVLVIVIGPRAGGLIIAVAMYGVVLGGTAALSTRCHPLVMCGGLFFLASDTILSFRIFALELMPDWTSGMVMLTYTVGQGLIVAGALLTVRRRAALAQGLRT